MLCSKCLQHCFEGILFVYNIVDIVCDRFEELPAFQHRKYFLISVVRVVSLQTPYNITHDRTRIRNTQDIITLSNIIGNTHISFLIISTTFTSLSIVRTTFIFHFFHLLLYLHLDNLREYYRNCILKIR